MAKSPEFPQKKYDDRPPFLNDGVSEVEFVDGAIVDGPPDKPIPAYVFNVKVLNSTNPMNGSNAVHTIRVKCQGWSWGETVQEIMGKAGLLPKSALSTPVCEALLASGKLKGRKFTVEMVTKTGKSKKPPFGDVTWREYKCAAKETTPVI